MSEKLHYSLVGQPELLDVVDDEWLHAALPDDGTLVGHLCKVRCKL